jgi:ribosome recycling factor
LTAEAEALGLKGKLKGDHIKLTVNPYTKLRRDQMEEIIKKRTE